ncbi:MAG: hypothetical protein EFT35_07630 [Methanophagales archaeon ANME-1-THS]|nr:MAG: hypothetical protein EFT35_07630 [Methanophagales archaeon ANME-1-THS]
MVTLNIHRSSLLIGLAIVAVSVLALSIPVCGAKEFVTVESVDLICETVYGTDMIKNGSQVSIKVVLSNFSKEIEGYTELIFYSDPRLGVPYPGVSIDGIPKAYPFIIDPRTAQKVTVTMIANAPEVNKRTEEPIVFLNITQKIKEQYPVHEIKRHVSSEAIEDAIAAVNTAKTELEKAQEAIANATEAGINVADAKKTFALANEHLNNSQSLYNEGRPEQALLEAQLAIDSAKEAKGEAEAAIGGKTKGNITLVVAVVVIAVVAFLVLTKKRRKKRKIY